MYKLISICLSAIAILPFWLLYRLSDLLFILLYYGFGYRKKVVQTNLEKAFPEKSIQERKKISKAFYRYLADLMVEIVKLKRLTRQQVISRVHLENPEEVLQYLDKGKSIHILTAHYGNWEWGIPRLALLSEHPALIVYKPLSNPVFERIFNEIRTRYGGIMVPMKKTLRSIIQHKDQTHSSVFLSDQTPGRIETNYFIPFLNQETLVYKGIEKIARNTGFPVVFCHIDRAKRGFYKVRFTTLASDPKSTPENQITLDHSRFLEEIIKQKPELWLWSHKRWKHQPKHE